MKCPNTDCNFSTNRKLSLRNHVESKHLKILRYACNSCDYKSYFDHHVKTHQRINHKGQQVKMIAINCTFCQKNVEHEKHFNPDAQLQHQPRMKQNRNDKFKCQINEKEQHTINSKYKCDECNHETNNPYFLSRHVDAVHKNIVRFKCNVCELKAYRKVAITEHFRRTHKNGVKLNRNLSEFQKLINK